MPLFLSFSSICTVLDSLFCTDVTLSFFFFHMYYILLIMLYQCHSFFSSFFAYVRYFTHYIVLLSLFLCFSSICTVLYSLFCTNVTLSFFFFHMYCTVLIILYQHRCHSFFLFLPYVLYSTHYIVPMPLFLSFSSICIVQ